MRLYGLAYGLVFLTRTLFVVIQRDHDEHSLIANITDAVACMVDLILSCTFY